MGGAFVSVSVFSSIIAGDGEGALGTCSPPPPIFERSSLKQYSQSRTTGGSCDLCPPPLPNHKIIPAPTRQCCYIDSPQPHSCEVAFLLVVAVFCDSTPCHVGVTFLLAVAFVPGASEEEAVGPVSSGTVSHLPGCVDTLGGLS